MSEDISDLIDNGPQQPVAASQAATDVAQPQMAAAPPQAPIAAPVDLAPHVGQAEMETHVNALIDAGASSASINSYMTSHGYTAVGSGLDHAIAYRASHGSTHFPTEILNGKDAEAPKTAEIADLIAAPSGSAAAPASDPALHTRLHDLAAGMTKPIDNLASLVAHGLPDNLAQGVRGWVAGHDADRAAAAYPNAVTAGGILTTLPMMAIPGVGEGAAGMFLTGATSGALLSDANSGGQVVGDMAKGGVLGVAGGKAAQGLGRLASPYVQKIGQALGMVSKEPSLVENAAQETALRVISRDMQRDGIDPAQAGQTLDNAASQGTPLALGDLGPNLRSRLASVGRAPGESKTIVNQAITARQDGQSDRVINAISDNLGPTTSVPDLADQLVKSARTKSAPLYAKADLHPGVSSPILDRILQAPATKSAMAGAQNIIGNDAASGLPVSATRMGFRTLADGSVELNPVPRASLDGIDLARAQYDKIAEIHATALNEPVESRALAVGQTQPLLDAASNRLDEAHAALASMPRGGVPVAVPGYSTRALDYVKQGLDASLEKYRNPITGNLDLDPLGRSIENVRKSLVNEADRLNPDYAAARQAYAGDAQIRAAVLKGNSALSMSPDDLSRATHGLTDPEVDGFKLGLRSAMKSKVSGLVDGANKVKALTGSPAKREALANIFGNDDGFNRFVNTLSDENQTSLTHGSVTGNSSTSERLAADGEPIEDTISGIAKRTATRSLLGHGFVANGVATLADLARYGSNQTGNAVRGHMASILTATDPSMIASNRAAMGSIFAARAARQSAGAGARIPLGYIGTGLGGAARASLAGGGGSGAQ